MMPFAPLHARRRRAATLGTAAIAVLFLVGAGAAPRAHANWLSPGWLSVAGVLEDPGATGFGIEFNGGFSPYPVMTTSVMPGDSLRVRALYYDGELHDEGELHFESALDFESAGAQDGAAVTAEADGGRLEPRSPSEWVWHAPSDPGFARITMHNSSTGEDRVLQVFVLVPYHGESVLNGFPIGRYEPEPLDGDPAYARPAGFIEVTPENEDTWVSPHFQLKQFLCKQKGDYPKYLLLQTSLLLKLERIHEELARERGAEPVVHVMSAYRTPKYNRSIGNRTSYSRHLYGDAADVYIDDDGDEVMDDWNGDGAPSVEDAAVLYARLELLHPAPWFPEFLGGLGLYGPGRDRGSFVHVDTRGSHARWGDKSGKRWLQAQGLLEDGDEPAGKRTPRPVLAAPEPAGSATTRR